ncbi:hypothetical protein CN140_01265 [Sinorhizobium meliloti]|uniref:hypothetical protein n=1 Tax=Rhizobium meliloti TaxID=382 RepID=UPI000FD966E0|nr:hypothetical protein [Sinorhizobium meliloti]RVL87590.1 hypothetical protein CN140_01265 [Sinorhizobium meliloti]
MTVKIGSMHIENAKVGLSVDTDADIEVGAATFKNVEVPYEVRRVGKAKISNTEIKDDPKVWRKRHPGRTISGWRKSPGGPPLPSYCPKCQTVFASQNYQFSGGYFSLWNNADTCIDCGYEKAQLSEGLFNLTREAIEILRGPDITHEMVKRLAALGDGVLSGKLRPEEAIAAASAIHPKLGAVAKAIFNAGVGAYLLYASLVGTVSATWDVADRLGLTSQEVVTQKVLEETLKEFGRSWHERANQPGRSIFDDSEEQAQGDQTTTPSKSKPAPGGLPSVHKQNCTPKAKKTKRLQMIKHRQSFGRSRTK